MRRSFHIIAAWSVSVVLGACGSMNESGDYQGDPSGGGPKPAKMCPDGEYPIAAAYGIDDGVFKWATCSSSSDMHVAVAATSTDLWLEIPYPPRTIRIDARTGEVMESVEGVAAKDIPADADRIRRSPPDIAGIRVAGGQDDPLVGIDVATGEELWRVVGFPVYDDVWATEGDSVFVRAWDTSGASADTWIVSYDLASGAERWRIDAAELGWPWHAAKGKLFAMWFDLQVIDVVDGSIVWQTSFGEPDGGFPRLFGAVTNDDAVFVSFTSVGAGGD